MDSRDTAKLGPSMVSPALRSSNVVVMAPSPSLRPDGPAAAGADHLAALVEEDVVMRHEQPFALDELVERAGLQRNDVARTRRDAVAPGLAGIHGAGRAHPVVRRRAGKHQENVYRRRRDQSAIKRGPGVGLVEKERVGLADRPAIELDRL